MHNPNFNKYIGDYCVVVRMNGNSELHRISDETKVFEESKGLISCRWLTHVQIQQIEPGVMVEFLCDDEAYPKWGNDATKVNPFGTYVYNRGEKPDHYILGDLVICLCVDGDEGGKFVGMSEGLATRIAMANNSEVIYKAMEVCGTPTKIPSPVVKVSSYATTDDMIRAMRGDKSVKPVDETIISGGEDAEEKA